MKDTAIEALVEASIELHGFDPEQCDTNTLSALGNLVSKVVRRHVLLIVAGECRWSLTRMATALRLSSVGDVIRAFKDLAPDELAAARRDGRITRGGDRRRTR